MKIHWDRLLDGTDLQNAHAFFDSIKITILKKLLFLSRTSAKKGSWKQDLEFFDFIKAMSLDELLPLREQFLTLNAPDLGELDSIIKDKTRQGSNWNNDAALKHYFESLRSDYFRQREVETFIRSLNSRELLLLFPATRS